MSDINQLPVIDLSAINKYVSERDLKLWKQHAFAKYIKIKYNEFHKENSLLDEKIHLHENDIKSMEKKIPNHEVLEKRMVESIKIASNAIDHLNQRTIDAENKVVTWNESDQKLLKQYSDMYGNKRKYYEERNPVHKELVNATNVTQKLKIQRDIVRQTKNDLEKLIKSKRKVYGMIRNYNIVDFVQSIQNSRRFEIITNEIPENKYIANVLLKNYQNQIKRENTHFMKQYPTELQKFPLGIKRVAEPIKLNMPYSFSMQKEKEMKETTVSKVDDVAILNKLKQRSDERRKVILQREFSNLGSPQTKRPAAKHSLTKSDNLISRTPASAETFEPPSKIKIIQNEVVHNTAAVQKKDTEYIRQPSLAKKKDAEKKKSKKVTFNENLSQNTEFKHPLNINEDINVNVSSQMDVTSSEEVSSYFTKMKSNPLNLFQTKSYNFSNSYQEEPTRETEFGFNEMSSDADEIGLDRTGNASFLDPELNMPHNELNNNFTYNRGIFEQGDNLWSQQSTQSSAFGGFNIF